MHLVLALLVGVGLQLVLEGLSWVLYVALDPLDPLHLRLEPLVVAAYDVHKMPPFRNSLLP